MCRRYSLSCACVSSPLRVRSSGTRRSFTDVASRSCRAHCAHRLGRGRVIATGDDEEGESVADRSHCIDWIVCVTLGEGMSCFGLGVVRACVFHTIHHSPHSPSTSSLPPFVLPCCLTVGDVLVDRLITQQRRMWLLRLLLFIFLLHVARTCLFICDSTVPLLMFAFITYSQRSCACSGIKHEFRRSLQLQ